MKSYQLSKIRRRTFQHLPEIAVTILILNMLFYSALCLKYTGYSYVSPDMSPSIEAGASANTMTLPVPVPTPKNEY